MHAFTDLTPDRFLPVLESSLGTRLTALARTLPSYINRVYELQAQNGASYVAKFYRPGRWAEEAIRDEHRFVRDCVEVDIPVVCPIELQGGDTLGMLDGIPFAVYPKRAGRQFELEQDDDWRRVGTLLGRLHTVGAARPAPSRITYHPANTTRPTVERLVADVVVDKWKQPYADICARIIDTIMPLFEGQACIRLHGDFHVGNILHRPGEGLMVIDFDDMVNGPPVQDMWLVLPEHYPACARELELLLDGYRQFRDVHPRAPLLIEGLRAMRMIYFVSWCSMQRDDFQFQARFPEWGTERFWAREVQDLREQYSYVMEALSR
ncbi:MAG: serine/threonine protein kinase [Chitinivibrionales bacterium]|nr:serine/threonine protein kinase [Chitinivibrionales bacterium]